MSWARLDDGWHDHPKTVAAGPEAAGVWAMCLTWAYRQRRKSDHPGVVPDGVVERFAGRRTPQIVKRLHEVRYFDDRTEHGWPIHDFADYLPGYDPGQAAEAGRRGGRVKRNGSEPLSEPLSEPSPEPLSEPSPEPLSEPSPEAKQTEPSRTPVIASARRNPVPTNPSLRSGTQQPSADVGRIVAAWVEAATEVQGDRPSSSLIARVGKQVKALVKEGKEADRLEAAARSAGSQAYDDIGKELLMMAARSRAAGPRQVTEQTWGPA